MSNTHNQGSQPSITPKPAVSVSQPAQQVQPANTLPAPQSSAAPPPEDPFALDPRLLGTLHEGARPEHTAIQQPDIVRSEKGK